MTDTRNQVNKLLESVAKPRSKFAIEEMPELRNAVEYFLDLKRDRDARAHMSLAWFYNNKLKDAYENAPSWDSVRRWVRDILKRNVATGADLG